MSATTRRHQPRPADVPTREEQPSETPTPTAPPEDPMTGFLDRVIVPLLVDRFRKEQEGR